MSDQTVPGLIISPKSFASEPSTVKSAPETVEEPKAPFNSFLPGAEVFAGITNNEEAEQRTLSAFIAAKITDAYGSVRFESVENRKHKLALTTIKFWSEILVLTAYPSDVYPLPYVPASFTFDIIFLWPAIWWASYLWLDEKEVVLTPYVRRLLCYISWLLFLWAKPYAQQETQAAQTIFSLRALLNM